MKKKRLVPAMLAVMLIGLFGVISAAAEQKAEVEALLRSRTDAVLEILKHKDMPDAEKQDKIMGIIEPSFDFPLMARLTLGRANWMKLNAGEQKEFIDLFVARLKKTYLEKTNLYSDEGVIYRPAEVMKDKIHAAVGIITSDKTLEIIYKFYDAGDEWKVYDVEIEGVSLVMSYRSQFNQILQRGAPGDLLDELRKDKIEAPPENMESTR
jgi:phospholipid transport system substrate-binding protein